MKKSFIKLFLASLTVLILTSFAVAPIVESRGGGGGGGGGGRGGGGGGYGGGRQVNNSNRDVRTNDVRNTSVNSINVNKNVNVDVDRHGGGWDNVDHPVAAAAVVAGAIAVTGAIVGSIVYTIPSDCIPVNYSGMVYQQCGNDWYQQDGTQYVVINPPY
jgi:hypothetical protein